MFRKRKTSQKPDENLISDFQKRFRHVVDPPVPQACRVDETDVKNVVPGFIPGLPFDPNSLNLPSMTGQSHWPYTPMCAIVHSPAGDLHTSTSPWTLGSPFWDQATNPPLNQHFNQYPRFSPRRHMPFYPGYQTQLFPNPDPFASGVAPATDISPYTGPQSDSPHVKEEALAPLDTTCHPDPPFRYRVTLHAPTAFLGSHESPVTYLNKAQAYAISIVDLSPPSVASEPVHYKTSIRISFDEDEHRASPTTCWQLWKKGRGSKEANQRGGTLRAVEFINVKDSTSSGSVIASNPQQPESASFDRFSVLWTHLPGMKAAECTIHVRFNFLSTDFSLSKGVKGVPVRLCAKTEILDDALDAGNDAEVTYCRVKVFRDHGAERKLSNDMAHLRKSIMRAKKDSMLADSDLKHKRRQNSVSGMGKSMKDSTAPIRMPPSRSGSASTDGDLEELLRSLESPSSSHLISVFSTKGSDQDDPDLCPILLPLDSTTDEKGSANKQILGLSHRPRITPGPSVDKAVNTDATLQSIACFYAKFLDAPDDNCYHAIYLKERTLCSLTLELSKHAQPHLRRINRVIHITQKGLHVVVDDEVVRHIPEGQDMLVRFCEAREPDLGTEDMPWPRGFDVTLRY